MNKNNQIKNKFSNKAKIWMIIGIVGSVALSFGIWGISQAQKKNSEEDLDCSKSQNEEQCLKEKEKTNQQ